MAMSLMTMSAQIKIDNEVKDCGMVEYEKPVTAVFTLTNESQRALRITDVETSCGCTGAEYPQAEIAAGQQFTVKLTYDSRMLGHFHKSALLHSNVSDTPMLLTMKGVVVTELQDYSGTYPHVFGDLLADKNVIEFDDVDPELEIELKEKTLTISSNQIMQELRFWLHEKGIHNWNFVS